MVIKAECSTSCASKLCLLLKLTKLFFLQD